MEVFCYEYEGVDAVKRALGAGIDLSTDDMPIKVTHQCLLQPINHNER